MTNPHALIASRYLLFCSLAAEYILKNRYVKVTLRGAFLHTLTFVQATTFLSVTHIQYPL